MDFNIQQNPELEEQVLLPKCYPSHSSCFYFCFSIRGLSHNILSHSEEAGYMVNEKHHRFSVCNSGPILPVLFSDSTHFT